MGLAENEFLKYLNKFNKSCFAAELDKQKHIIGEGEPAFTLRFHNLPEIEDLLKSASIAVGEAYMAGELEIDGDLYDTFNIFLSQFDKISIDKKALKKLLRQSKTKHGLKKNAEAYYELGVRFYELILDKTMCYSAGYFKDLENTLEQAQNNNIKYILKKLNIKDNMSVCDISCSWGSLLIEAAKMYDIKGLLVTLSREQEAEISERIRKEGLENKLEVRQIDYHEFSALNRTFDCVISIDILEYIEQKSFCEYFSSIKSILKEEGTLLLQSVSTINKDMANPWINKYIKPGTKVPFIADILKACSECGFKMVDVEDMRRHAVCTYMKWNENLHNNIEEIEEMYDKKFIRAWELYLNGYRAALNTGLIDCHQIIMSNGTNNNLPHTRWFTEI